MIQKLVNKLQYQLTERVTGGNEKAAQAIIAVLCIVLIAFSWICILSDGKETGITQGEEGIPFNEEGLIVDANGGYMPPDGEF